MDTASTLSGLQAIQKRSLSIIRLAEPVLVKIPAPSISSSGAKRDSDISCAADASADPTPSSLAADLAHYKELFSKLRFSYLEQVTKEKFLRAIVGDPPLIVEHEDNLRLEQELAFKKADLKAQKEEVAAMMLELEAIGRDLSQRHEQIQLQTTQLATLPAEIEALDGTIKRLQAQQSERNRGEPEQNLPLPATLALLDERNNEAERLDAQIRALQSAIPARKREFERLQNELRPLEMQKKQAVAVARDAMRRKENGEKGVGDDLEMKGRWYSGVGVAMGNVLGTEV